MTRRVWTYLSWTNSKRWLVSTPGVEPDPLEPVGGRQQDLRGEKEHRRLRLPEDLLGGGIGVMADLLVGAEGGVLQVLVQNTSLAMPLKLIPPATISLECQKT